jgi:RecB family exonuclease
MATYSHSRLSTFEQCRQKYKFRYLDGIRVPGQSVEAFLGSVVHEVLERLYEDVRHTKVPDIDELLRDYRERWEKQWSGEVVIVRKGYTARHYFDMGAGFLRDYYARHHPFDQGRILGLETQDFLDLGDGIRFHVRIDRLMDEGGGVYSVNDYKTSRSLAGQDEVDSDRQLAAYSIWVRERFFDAVRVRLVWHYLAHDRHLESERSVEQLEQLREEIRRVVGEIESCRAFPTTTSTLCDWCEYRDICPAWVHELKVSKLDEKQFGEDDGVKLVDRLAELEGRSRELDGEIAAVREDLAAYARRYGVTAVAGTESKATIVETEAAVVPRKGTPERQVLEEKLRARGLYADLLSLDAAAVKRLDEALLEELGLERETKTQVRLKRR